MDGFYILNQSLNDVFIYCGHTFKYLKKAPNVCRWFGSGSLSGDGTILDN